MSTASSELDDALRAARWRAGARGGSSWRARRAAGAARLAAVRDHAVAAGLDVVSFDHVARRLVLAATPRAALAA